MTNKKEQIIFIAGGDSKIGRSLALRLSKLGYKVIKTSRRTQTNGEYWPLDLSTQTKAYDLPKNISAAFICAGIPSFEECRLHPDKTYVVNVQQTEVLCKQIADLGARVIFLSSASVYDGSSPYRKIEELPCPITEYGYQKAEIEQRLLALNKNVLIIRLTKVITKQLPLLSDWIRALKDGQPIHPREDMFLAPLSLDFVLNILTQLLDTPYKGILHLSGTENITYAQLAQEIARQLDANLDLVQPINNPTFSSINSNNTEPHTTLDASILEKLLTVQIPSYPFVIKSLLSENADALQSLAN